MAKRYLGRLDLQKLKLGQGYIIIIWPLPLPLGDFLRNFFKTGKNLYGLIGVKEKRGKRKEKRGILVKKGKIFLFYFRGKYRSL